MAEGGLDFGPGSSRVPAVNLYRISTFFACWSLHQGQGHR